MGYNSYWVCDKCGAKYDTAMNSIQLFVSANGDVRYIWLCEPCIIMFREWLKESNASTSET